MGRTLIPGHVDDGDEDAAGGGEQEGAAVALHSAEGGQQGDDGDHRGHLEL